MKGISRSDMLILWAALMILPCLQAGAQSFVIIQFRPPVHEGRAMVYRVGELVKFGKPWVLHSDKGITQSIVYPGAAVPTCATMTPGALPGDPWQVNFDGKTPGYRWFGVDPRDRSFHRVSAAKAYAEKECR